MKTFYRVALIAFLFCKAHTGHSQQAENIIIITTDGFRWQEVFTGMDSSIANNQKFNQGDSDYIFRKYWSNDATERRKKLLPFLWSAISANGQIYGNRNYDNKVNNANPYWFSYPGYSELMTGYPDTAINSNEYPANPHVTVLEYLNQQPKFKNKVVAFGAWSAFDRILNEQRSKIPVYSAFDTLKGPGLTSTERLLNVMLQNSYRPFGDGECLDVFTHYMAMDYFHTKKPKILYIAYGETDEWAHAGNYKSYLDAAHQVDAWIKDLWNTIQQLPSYKNKTAILFTVDHGRGINEKWTSHNNTIEHSNETWFALMGPGIAAKGEIKNNGQFYQQQLAQSITRILGLIYKPNHKIASAINEVFIK
ncbi:MAG: phosphoglyceromutase [Sphingobacteriales bacterium]